MGGFGRLYIGSKYDLTLKEARSEKLYWQIGIAENMREKDHSCIISQNIENTNGKDLVINFFAPSSTYSLSLQIHTIAIFDDLEPDLN